MNNMDILLGLFLIFAKLSLFSFGGGYVMVPAAMAELEANHWATAAELTNTVAIATMSPGPVGVNLAVGLGYKVAGIAGAVAAFMGITIPTTILVIIVASFFFRIYKHPLVSSVFYGMRPVITGVILSAAASLAVKNNIITIASNEMITGGYHVIFNEMYSFELKSVLIAITVFLLLAKTRIAPIYLIVCSGILGVAVF